MPSPNYDSFYKEYSGKTLEWLPMDTEELYKKHLTTHYDDLKNAGWIDKKFTYQFNSHGFRSQEFSDSDPTIMFLGCSFTVGIGLPVENIWPEILSKKLGMRCANLGIGGSSSDTAFRLCQGYIDKIKPKMVIFMKPPGIRTELVTDQNLYNVTAEQSPHMHDFLKHWAFDENNNFFNFKKNLLAMKFLCHQREIKFVSTDWTILDKFDIGGYRARDLAHCGVKSHLMLACDLAEQI